jgi:hypothetical protein
MKKKRAMKAIIEDWTEEEEENLAFMLKLRELKGGVGISASSEKNRGAFVENPLRKPCRHFVTVRNAVMMVADSSCWVSPRSRRGFFLGVTWTY